MVKIIDRRNQAIGGQSNDRRESAIRGIAWHYTAVDRLRNAFITGHERYWRDTLGWRRGGYHYYIDSKGNIYQNYNLTTVSNGVKNNNSYLVHISVEANSSGNYSQAQIKARKELTLYLMKRLGLSASAVKQHGEYPGARTSCAGYTTSQMNAFRSELVGGKAPVIKPSISDFNPNKSITTVAQEVMAGKWGNGQDRIERLGTAGFNASAVQQEVNRLAGGGKPSVPKKSNTTIAKEVLAGKWGNGTDRTNRLNSAGYNASVVQSEVNKLAGQSAPKPSLKSTDTIAKEVLAGNWGNGSTREDRLKRAGYNPSVIQNHVNKLAGGGGSSRKSASAVANDIIAGRGGWGTGTARVNKLRKAGYNPQEVQRLINQRL